MIESYPFLHHPCYSSTRERLWERIHLPMAELCNTKCLYCDHSASHSCHTSRPGYGSKLMGVEEAIQRVIIEKEKHPSLRIVAVSGPGDPLFNNETFEALSRIHSLFKDVEFCLSTNGILLSDSIANLVNLGLRTLTVTMNCVTPQTAARLYEWGLIDGVRLNGLKMGIEITKRQQKGIKDATDQGIHVKVNTVLIPGYNNHELRDIAKRCAFLGVSLQNIVPLFPYAKLATSRRPTTFEISETRQMCEKYIPQFYYCQQCRCDVVGVPGLDTVL